MKLTKQEKNKIWQLSKNHAEDIQLMLVSDFKFKKVGAEYLELPIKDDLLEVRVYSFLGELGVTVNYFKGNRLTLNNRYANVEEAYLQIKEIVKG